VLLKETVFGGILKDTVCGKWARFGLSVLKQVVATRIHVKRHI